MNAGYKTKPTEPKYSPMTFQRNGVVSGADLNPPLRSGQEVKLRTRRAVHLGAQQILSSSLQSFSIVGGIKHSTCGVLSTEIRR